MAVGRHQIIHECTVADVTGGNVNTARMYFLTDAANYGDLTTGGGSIVGLIAHDGSAWQWIGGVLSDGSDVIINPSEDDVDTYIKTNSGAHAGIFVRGSDGFVGINDTAPNRIFTVRDDSAQLRLERESTTDHLEITVTTSAVLLAPSVNLFAIRAPADNIVLFEAQNASNVGIVRYSSNSGGDGIVYVRDASGSSNSQFHGNGNNYVNANAGNFGVGETSPGEKLHVSDSGSVTCRVESTGNNNVHLRLRSNSDNRRLIGEDSAGTIESQVALYQGRVNIWGATATGDVNLLLGHNTPPTGTAKKVMSFPDNTGDPTMGANTAGIYAKDVSGTVEMFAIDEANNATQLSPHDPEGRWAPLMRGREGKWHRVKMWRVIELLEELTGETLTEEEGDE